MKKNCIFQSRLLKEWHYFTFSLTVGLTDNSSLFTSCQSTAVSQIIQPLENSTVHWRKNIKMGKANKI